MQQMLGSTGLEIFEAFFSRGKPFVMIAEKDRLGSILILKPIH